MKNKTVAIIFLVSILTSYFLWNDVSAVLANTTISATIGSPILRLWGYGPTNSRIELSGDRVSEFTYSNSSGFFEFKKAFLPRPIDIYYPELCIIAIDQANRSTPPVCIPALPAIWAGYDVGPVILPPTISLDAISLDELTASGVTIPNSKVNVYFAKDRFLPVLGIATDNQGNFSFNLPSEEITSWRVFAMTLYSQGNTSPKSNTLEFKIISEGSLLVYSIWMYLLSLLTLPALIVLEVLIVLIILIIISRKKR